MLLRGENARETQLADLFDLEFEGEGPSDCFPLIAVLRQGKMNQVGRVEYAGIMRHKDVNRCAIGSLSLLLFWRWEISDEAHPTFSTNRDWYDHFVQTSSPRTPTASITYKTQWFFIN